MTRIAKRDQIFLCVVSRMAAEFLVVYVEIRHRPAGLTPPAVAMQDLPAQIFVRQRIEPQPSGSCLGERRVRSPAWFRHIFHRSQDGEDVPNDALRWHGCVVPQFRS